MAGRPVKINERILKAYRDVLDEPNACFLTDDELLTLVNARLSKEDKIQDTTQDRFIAYTYGRYDTDSVENKEKFEMIKGLIKEARAKKKRNLLNSIDKGVHNWQSKAWITERQYKDFNLKNISEVKQTSQIIYQALDSGQVIEVEALPVEDAEMLSEGQQEAKNQ